MIPPIPSNQLVLVVPDHQSILPDVNPNPDNNPNPIDPPSAALQEVQAPNSDRPAAVHSIFATTIPSNLTELHQISAAIEKIEKRANAYLGRIVSIDNVMRETIALITDIACIQLDILKTLLAQPVEKRDFYIIPRIINERVMKIKEDNMADYRELVKVKDSYMEDGIEKPLTKEKRQELIGVFAAALESLIQKYISQIRIDPSIDLEQAKKQIEERIDINKKAYIQMLDSKTELTEVMFRTMAECKPYAEQRQKLFAPLVTDIWSASRLGGSDFIEKAIGALGLFRFKSTLLNQKNKEGEAPLHIAARHLQLPVVQLLLQRNADPFLRTGTASQEPIGYLPIHLAARAGGISIVTEFLKCKVSINARGLFDRTPLHMAGLSSQYDMTIFLLENGADINAQPNVQGHGKTALHEATLRLDLNMVTLLVLRKNLNVNIPDSQNHTPLWHAVLDGHLEIAALIIGHPSWEIPLNLENPNHPQQLLKLKPKRNAEALKNMLSNLH